MDFFDEWYRTEYEATLALRDTAGEVKFIGEMLGLGHGSRVLDLCCGRGRHAVLLAARGCSVVGQDLNQGAIEYARAQSSEVEFVVRDMRDIPYDDEFDAVINIFTAFGYLEHEKEDQKVFHAIARALKPGGALLMDIMNQTALMREYLPRDFLPVNDGMMLIERRYEGLSGRNLEKRTTIHADGTRTVTTVSLRVYTPAELRHMMETAGLLVVELLGDLSGQPWTMRGKRSVIVARKPLTSR